MAFLLDVSLIPAISCSWGRRSLLSLTTSSGIVKDDRLLCISCACFHSVAFPVTVRMYLLKSFQFLCVILFLFENSRKCASYSCSLLYHVVYPNYISICTRNVHFTSTSAQKRKLYEPTPIFDSTLAIRSREFRVCKSENGIQRRSRF